MLACYYAWHGTLRISREDLCLELDPLVLYPEDWDRKFAGRYKKSRIEQLTVAGALIVAEIERIKRAEAER